MDSIYSFVRRQENWYKTGSTQIAKYVSHSLSETVQTIYAYLNSKHISGEQDSLGRDKVSFNIVIAARNIWFRATDLDRKHIVIRETDSDHVVSAFLATIKLQDWMRRERFGVFLNDWGLVLAGFGSAVSKWVMKDGTLIPSVVPWNKIICDAVDFDGNPKIEIFEYTPAQLREKADYDQTIVDSLIQSLTVRMNINGELVDVKPDFVKVYEVHGRFPKSFISGKEEDKTKYEQQMHVISYTKSSVRGKYDNFALFQGYEAEDPYRKDDLIKEDGRTLAIGSVEHLFQSQWMVNHSAKAIKDQLDLASKLIFQTSDPAFVGVNVLSNIETGQILMHKLNEPLSAVPNGSHDVGSLQSYMNQWKALGQEINGVSDSMIGVRPKAGTSWKLNNQQLEESQALFDLMKQNKGLAIEDMLREKIIPYIKRYKLTDTKEIVATLESHQIKKIDSMYVPEEATKRFNKKVIDHVLSTGTRPIGIDLKAEMDQVQNEVDQSGNVRFFKPSEIKSKTWKTIFKDLEWNVEVDVTGEESDTNAILQTLNTALQIVVNPGYANNPQAQMIVNKILLSTGRVSPLEINSFSPQAITSAAPPGASVGAPAVGVGQ